MEWHWISPQKPRRHFPNVERKELSTQNAIPLKISFRNERGIKIVAGEGTKRTCHQHTHPKRMAD